MEAQMQSISEVGNVADVAGSDESPDRSHNAFLWTLAGLLIAGLWLPSLVSSLWIDEAGTWWVIADGVHQVVQRAEAVQGQSPLFYLLLWSWVHLAGHSEVALRLPSVVSSLVSAWFVYLIAKRFFDGEVGRLAVIAFVAWSPVAFEASNARPYALGTLLVTGAAWALIDWLDRGGIRRAVVFVLLAVLVPYVHPFLALMFLPYATYALLRAREGSSAVSTKSLIAAAVSIAVLVAPICVQLIALARRREELSTPQTVSLSLILTMLIPTAFIATAVFILLISARAPIRFTPRAMAVPTKYLLISWLLIPAGVLILVAALTSLQLLQPRYFVAIAPAGAIITAYLLRSLGPPSIRRMIVMVLVILSVLDLAATSKMGDMRGAMALARSQADDQTTTLLTFGFRESLHPPFYRDPVRASFLTAPALYYPVPGRVVAMPIDSPAFAYPTAREQVDAAMATSDRVIVVSQTGSVYEPWLGEVFREAGYRSRVVGMAALYTVTEFMRDPA